MQHQDPSYRDQPYQEPTGPMSSSGYQPGADDIPTSPRGYPGAYPGAASPYGTPYPGDETFATPFTSPPPPPVSAAIPAARRPAWGRGPRVSRRGLLLGAGAVGVTAAALTTGILYARGSIKNPFTPPVSAATNQQIAHLLRRAGFGGQSSDIQHYAALGFTGAVDELLNYDSVNDPLDANLSKMSFDFTTVADMQRWWVLRMIYTKRPFQEKMTLFWHGLLTSSFQKLGGSQNYPYMIQQNQFLRAHALDTFDNILLGITTDPAMMWWLDLRLSSKNAPNENYARELMELFTMGVNSGYTQTDVHEAARALTGWMLARGATQGVYVPAQHDNGQKTLLGHTGNLGMQDVIRIVASHPATGPPLCKRLFAFFVHENPSDADVAPMVQAYNSSNHSLKAVVRAMFLSDAFLATTAYRSRLKSPSEFVIGALRQLQVPTDGQGVGGAIAQMGQVLFAPPNVAGWPGDVSSDQWINTATWLDRVNLVNLLIDGYGTARGANPSAHLQSLITANNISTAEGFRQYFESFLLDGQFADDRRQTIDSYLNAQSSGQTLNLVGGKTIPASNVRAALYLMMASPEYQLN